MSVWTIGFVLAALVVGVAWLIRHHLYHRCRQCGSFWVRTSLVDHEAPGGPSYWQSCHYCGTGYFYANPRRALVVVRHFLDGKYTNPVLVSALQLLGYEIVEIPNNPEGWAELRKRGLCREHDFQLLIFNGGNLPVDDMPDTFIKQEMPPDAAVTIGALNRLDESSPMECCPVCPEH